MQNNHYSIIRPFVDSSMIEKQQVKALGLSVHQERLRERINGASIRYEPSATAACTAHSSPLNLTKENISPVKGIPAARSRINWVKFNILVSIYQNWLRLEPFIRYWLSRTYQKWEVGQNRRWPFLRKRQEGRQQEAGKQVEVMDILDEIRLRRDELLMGLEPSQCDIERLCFARQLARQLLSSLPLQNNKWSKMRIQKQNRLLEEMINNFNEEQFQMNSDAIMHSIKERIYFIDQMQKKFIDISKEQKNKLEEKLELLKLPFKKVFNQTNKRSIQPEALFQSLWQEIESERSKLLTKKPQLRHATKKVKPKQRYAIIQKSEIEGLVVKYQLKHGDFYNDSYIRSHSKTRKLKRKNNQATSINDSLQTSKVAEVTKDSVDQLAINEQTDSNISQSPNKDQEEVDAQFVEDFMRRQKLKPTYRDQTSTFFKKTPTKFDNSYSHYRPSISYVDGRSNKDTDHSAMRSGISIRERTSLFGRRQSRQRPSGEEITEKEDHVSRFRSHKKLITLKNIGGAGRHTKLKEQSKKESQLGTLSRISERLSKMHRKEYRREPVDYRKGVLHKKGVHRREAIPDEEISIVPENLFNLNRQEFLSYFTKILAQGHLDQEKYQSLKDQVKELVKKNEISALQETHAYVSKLVEKSTEEHFSCLLGGGREQLLFDLSEIISKDQRIRAKIREEMKIFFMESVEECCSEESISNEQFVYNTTELRKVNQELKRVICFRSEGESLSLAKRLIKESSILGQRAI